MSLVSIAFFDPPRLIDTRVTPIPASSSQPLQVIADTGKQTGVGISYSDTTGEIIGVYIGPVGQEQLLCSIGNGLTTQSWGNVPANSRISLRNMQNRSITNGLLFGAIVSG